MKITKGLFHKDKGIIVSLDILELKKLKRVVKRTKDVEGVVGYKVSGRYGLVNGLKEITKNIRKKTSLAIILDYQKAGTDTPHIEKASINAWKEYVDAAIIFPMSGPASMEKSIETMVKHNVIPIVGGEMTHQKYLKKDGGYISSVDRMYLHAAELGARHFVGPANKSDRIKEISELLRDYEPILLMPGVGEQWGNIKDAMRTAKGKKCYFIIGRSIINTKNIKESCENLAKMLEKWKS